MFDKDGIALFKSFLKKIDAVNVNLVDLAKSLRKIASRMERENEPWNPVDENGNPGPEYGGYDWVLVKIADDPEFMPVKVERVHELPHIAKFRNGQWLSEEWKEVYGTLTVPFKVISWRPIPGDSCETLYCDGKPMKRIHSYE